MLINLTENVILVSNAGFPMTWIKACIKDRTKENVNCRKWKANQHSRYFNKLLYLDCFAWYASILFLIPKFFQIYLHFPTWRISVKIYLFLTWCLWLGHLELEAIHFYNEIHFPHIQLLALWLRKTLWENFNWF